LSGSFFGNCKPAKVELLSPSKAGLGAGHARDNSAPLHGGT
jgi:hypothetical protein